MKDIEKALKEELSVHFVGHGQRLAMMSKLVMAVIKMSTVNFARLALVINAAVKTCSNFKRVQRFVREYSFCQRCFVRFAWALYGNEGSWVALSMDRTNWKFGRANINILTIGISYRGTAIPLVWMLLDKRGQSSQAERILLLERLLSCLDAGQKGRIRHLLMDREFGANDWLGHLKKRGIHFVVRIRKDAKVRIPGKEMEAHAWRLFETDSFRALRKRRVVFGQRLFIAGQRTGDKEHLILLSDEPLARGGRLYAERWGIEVFFGSLKTRGFNFEDTHLKALERIDAVMFILAIAFVWCLKTGEYLLENGHQVPLKQLERRKAKLVSIFRLGLDHLKHKLLNFLSLYLEIKFLSCT